MVEGGGKEKCEGVVSTFSLGEPLELGLLDPTRDLCEVDLQKRGKLQLSRLYAGHSPAILKPQNK